MKTLETSVHKRQENEAEPHTHTQVFSKYKSKVKKKFTHGLTSIFC